MTEIPPKLTREELAIQVEIPQILKQAIEDAIYEMALPDDPEDEIWPDYFRAEVAKVEIESTLSPGVEVDDHFYVTEAGWFQAGWKAYKHSNGNDGG